MSPAEDLMSLDPVSLLLGCAEGGRSLLPVSRRHKATRLHYKAGDSYELYKELPKEAVSRPLHC